MTLILGCLTHERIVVAVDRRLTRADGTVHDDDANKAVFFGGRIALAYTGLAQLEGKDTADWLAEQLAPHARIKDGMHAVASRATDVLKATRGREKRVAFLAFGWATLQQEPPPLPFVCLATNFMSDSDGWLATALPTLTVRTHFVPPEQSHLLVAAGQSLYRSEFVVLDRLLRRAAQHHVGPSVFARLLGTQIQLVANGSDARSTRVGNGLVIQALVKAIIVAEERTRFSGALFTPLTPDANSFVYVRNDGALLPSQFPVMVGDGGVIKGFAGNIDPELRSILDEGSPNT
jgi:hypothetical protein